MKITVITGFGYYKDSQGHVVAKAELPPGDHDLNDLYNYIEVGSKAELDAVIVWTDPIETAKFQNEQKITNKIRKKAIADLIATGDLPTGYS